MKRNRMDTDDAENNEAAKGKITPEGISKILENYSQYSKSEVQITC